MKEFDLRGFLARLPNGGRDLSGHPASLREDVPEDDHVDPRSSTGRNLSEWRRSPFPILVCMSFRTPPIVPQVWQSHIEPTVSEIGQVIRVDWTTDDWVEDLRQVVSDAAFVLLDLTSANWNVSRELKYLLDEDIQVMVYMNSADEPKRRTSILGQVCPRLAITDANGTVDPELLSFPITVARYDDPAEIERLCEEIRKTLLPLQDTVDPSAPYVGTDVSQLDPDEQKGFDLARVPRSRIIATSERLARTVGEDYWTKAREMMLTSAIYRARVFSWLGNPNLLVDTPENVWIRENLICCVLDTVRHGNKLAPDEQDTIRHMMTREPVEDITLECMDILSAASAATTTPPALRRGIPDVPHRKQQTATAGRIRVRIDLRHAAADPLLGAERWEESIPDTDEDLIDVLRGASGVGARPRCFTVDAYDGPSAQYEGVCGQIEDCLDAAAPSFRSLIVLATEAEWTQSEVADLVRAVVSVTALQELARQRQNGGARDFIESLIVHFAQVWGIAAEDLRLFEFQSKTQGTYFRGLLPWRELRELVAKLYASVVSPMIGKEEDDVCRSILSWDFPPSQAWDIVIVQRWRELLDNPLTRQAWCRFAIPSAFFRYNVEQLFVNPHHVDRWAYVLRG